MGLDYHTVKLILKAKSQLSQIESVATIGRMGLTLRAFQLKSLLNLRENTDAIKREFFQDDGFCETFFHKIGVKEVDSFDFSSFENASYIHDFNLPIPKDFHSKYDMVVDGGTLEHIFDFPNALRNCFKLLRKDGIFISSTPTNNQCGHGFYQFSPELYFSLCRLKNNLNLMYLYIWEVYDHAPWYEVVDPDKIDQRLYLFNTKPTKMGVVIQKVTEELDFPSKVYQIYYLRQWDKGEGEKTDQRSVFRRRLPLFIRIGYRFIYDVIYLNLYMKLISNFFPYKRKYFKKVKV